MDDLIIQTHDFERSKKELQKFSQKKPEDVGLSRVDSRGGLFGWFSHNVTGDELNFLTSQIQEYLIELHNENHKTVKQFGEVYNALEALDKDYIKAILVAIKNAENAIDTANKAIKGNEKSINAAHNAIQANKETSEALKRSQDDLRKLSESQKKTLEVLVSFKQKLNAYEHINDVDKIWNDCRNLEHAMEKSSENLQKIIHLQDVDEMWGSLSALHISIESLKEAEENFRFRINEQLEQASKTHADTFNSFCETFRLKIEQLESKYSDKTDELARADKRILDEINTTRIAMENLRDLEKKLSSVSHFSYVDDMWNYVEEHKTQLEKCKKRIKGAYLLAGSAVGLAVTEFVLLLLKVI